MTVIARLLMAYDSTIASCQTSTPQFKHAIMALASDAACLAAEHPQIATSIFQELLNEIARVRYYPPKTPRPPCPRICKKSINKWQRARAKKLGRS